MERLLLTAEQAAEALNVSRWRVFELIRSGRLGSIKLGASRRIPTDAVREFITREMEEVSG